MDVFGQIEDRDPKTPTRPRKQTVTTPDTQMEVEVEQESRTMSEAEAIVVYQLENIMRELQKLLDHHVWSDHTRAAAYKITKKMLPEVIEAGESQQADGAADSARALQETAELRLTVKDLAKVVTTLAACQDAKPTTTKGNQGGIQEAEGVKTVFASGKLYKPTKANSTQTKVAAQIQHANPRTPKDQYHPACLIVIPHGEKFDTNYLNPRKLVNLINNHLAHAENAKHLCVAFAHYNFNQNLVIMMHEDQKGKELRQHMEKFIDIFGVPAHTIKMITDDRRYKVRINGVWTGRDGKDDENSIHTPKDLLEEIQQFNLVMSKVELKGKPRWL
ncbi:hypothetical protein C0993_006031 [Termitomyces sp. T159_Od127]|nr:hypothetical protein C0993_006031 [Termitomyces sp. T159_Od127]